MRQFNGKVLREIGFLKIYTEIHCACASRKTTFGVWEKQLRY